ncbi:endoplasmic reticulum membrane sensor NFE2L1a [Aulostomus maculatus]
MLYLKKYFTEGLIQLAILLSLCGVRVDVGLEPYLPPSWHEMILGPTSALTQTQFHNLRNRLEDGQGLHPKSVDLDGFFTTRRLLGWVRSLDRLQVPHAELETWLVQREPESLSGAHPEQPSILSRVPLVVHREPAGPPVEPTGRAEEEEEQPDDREEGAYRELNHSSALDEREQQEQEDLARWAGRGGGAYHGANGREQTQSELDQTSSSLEECLRLLEENFPFTEEQACHVGDRRGGLEQQQPPGREPLLPPVIPTSISSMDLELHWQDLLAVMEPENIDVDMASSFDGAAGLDADPVGHLMETPLQEALVGPERHSEFQAPLLPLTPSTDLDDHSSASKARDTLKTSSPGSVPDHRGLLAEDPSEDFLLGLNGEHNSSTLNLLPEVLVDNMERSPCSQFASCADTLANCDASPQSCHTTPSNFMASLAGNEVTQDLLTSCPTLFPGEEDEDGLLSPLTDLLDDASILDEIRLLDLVLEDGFSQVARLEEENYLDGEVETGLLSHNTASEEERDEQRGQSRPETHQQDSEEEADSDSGLSLDFSHSPSSPCASESSSYSSSSYSSSASSSSSVSPVGSPFSDDDKSAEEGCVVSEMEVEVSIKQEEEEMGAVGGDFSEDKLFPLNCGDYKLFNGFPWLEHVGHDHTYNQPRSSSSPPSMCKMTTKHTKSFPRHDSKPYSRSSPRQKSGTKLWSRDERRAQALKIPFSNELIVNLPVEEFNELLNNYQLSEDQLILVRDIRRRGKNKIAAQNCRKRKMGVLLELEDDVSELQRRRSQLLRDKKEALRNLKVFKRQLSILQQDVFSRLRDTEGRPLDTTQYSLSFEPNGSVILVPHQQGAGLPRSSERTSKKHRKKK